MSGCISSPTRTTRSDRNPPGASALVDPRQVSIPVDEDGKLAKCSHDTALRDIAALVERGILARIIREVEEI